MPAPDPAIRADAFTQAGIAANLRGDPRGALELATRATQAVSGNRLPMLNLIQNISQPGKV